MKKPYSALLVPVLWAVSFIAWAAADPQDLLEEQWLEARSPHFHIITDAKEKVARKMAQDLENFRFFVSRLLRVDLVEGLPPVKILAVAQTSNFKDLGLPDNWGGVFQQTVDGAYAIANISRYELDSDDTNLGKQVLLHEYVHYVNENTFSKLFYPLWYSEGLAEYLSTFKYENNEITYGSAEALASRAYSLDFRSGRLRNLGLEELFKTRSLNMHSDRRADSQAAYRFYAKATLVVHYLNSSNENQKAARDYIAMINEGYDIDFAFRKSFSREFKELEREVLDYVNKDRLMMRKLSSEGGIGFPVVDMKVSSLSDSNACYHLSDFLMRFYRSNEVGFDPIMNLMKKSLEGDQDNVEKKILIAHFLYVDGRYDEAGRQLEEVLKQRPEHPSALALNGDLVLDEAVTLRQVGLPGWEQLLDRARNQYRKAIRRDRANGRAYYGLARSYTLKTADEPLDEAFVALDSARFFSPDRELLWYEAVLRLRKHDNEKVIPLLRRYVNVGEGDNFAVARSLLDLQELRLLPKQPADNPSPGHYQYVDGSAYEGGWKQGMPEGKGNLVRPNGVKYSGSWQGGLIHGDGEFVSSNGHRYIMSFKNGEATGTGELLHPNGSYRGELLNGIAHGKGEAGYLKDGKPAGKYVGQFWLTLKNGSGIAYAEDGTSTTTDWIFGKRKIDLSEELSYVGDVNEQGKPHGWGRCIYKKKDNMVEWCGYTDGVMNKGADE